MTPDMLDEIEARALAAKEHEYELDDEGEYDCPLCENGYTEGRRYESKIEAATIVAYGIGRGLELASTWVEQGPDDVLALVAEVRRLFALRTSELNSSLDEASARGRFVQKQLERS